jgi:hypothetical protein
MMSFLNVPFIFVQEFEREAQGTCWSARGAGFEGTMAIGEVHLDEQSSSLSRKRDKDCILT